MNFCKRSYQPILRYLYTEATNRRGEISLQKHFNHRRMGDLNGQSYHVLELSGRFCCAPRYIFEIFLFFKITLW